MRGLLALLALGGPAAADPKPLSLPDIVKEAAKAQPLVTHAGVAGMDGKLSAAIVLDPGEHHDQGFLKKPPDPNDPIALELGTNRQKMKIRLFPEPAWLPRDLSRGLGKGADTLWDIVLPKL